MGKLRKRYKSLDKRKDDPFSRYWYTKASTLWSKIIRSRAKGCVRCGKSDGVINAHHLLSKENYPQFQFDLNNGVALCFMCHKRFAHRECVAFAQWLKKSSPDQYEWTENRYEQERKTEVNYREEFERMERLEADIGEC